jgi:hypothetical protein
MSNLTVTSAARRLCFCFITTITAFTISAFQPSQVSAQTPKTKQSAATRAAAKTATPIDVAINKAERLVMLSQRAAKLYAQGALGVSAARSSIQLTDSITQFEADLAWLKANAPAPTIAISANEQYNAWNALKAYLVKPPIRDNIDEVGDLSETLYTKAKLTALSVEAMTTNPLDEIVGQSAKQRALIQRLGKLYMFERAGFKDAKKKFEIEKAEFLKHHDLLAAAKESNADIKRELDQILGQAKMLFVNFVDGKIGGEQNDALVGKSIEVMMQMQDTVTTMFEKL